MTLELWLDNGWLKRHQTTRAEITELLAVADRNLADAAIDAVSADARVGFAHAASIAVANAALAAAGYRPSRERHHERLIDSLAHTMGADTKLIKRLHAQRVARNTMTYERIGTVSGAEARRAVTEAQELVERVRRWLLKAHPKLLPAEE